MNTSKDKITIDPKSKAENFPVGSLLIDKKYRKYIHAFYNFARAADDVADNPSLSGDEKKIILRTFSNALKGQRKTPNTAYYLRELMMEYKPEALRHCHDLLRAFAQDAGEEKIRTSSDLMNYCRYSASSVGRFVLDVHGEEEILYPYSDALCSALQILNHVQDIAEDYTESGRVYIPEKWLEKAGIGKEALGHHSLTDDLKKVVLRLLKDVDQMIEFASPLCHQIENRRLSYEIAVIWQLAYDLCAKLKTHDMLQQKISLTSGEKVTSVLKGLKKALFAKPKMNEAQQYIHNLVEEAGTSFYWAMRFLPRHKRMAMYTVYAFCSEIDDIADGPSLPAKKREQLAIWKKALDEESDLFVMQELADVTKSFGLNPDRLHDIVKGVSMDLGNEMYIPSLAHLMIYCYRVAGAVGLLSLRIFGVRDADKFGTTMGEALQLTNILRDLREDAEMGRLYMPKEFLMEAGFKEADLKKSPLEILEDPRFFAARQKMIDLAEEKYAFVIPYFKEHKTKNLKPAYIMMQIYHRIFEKSKLQRDPLASVSLSKIEKVLVSLKAYVTYR